MKKKWQADILINESRVKKCLQAQFPSLLLKEISCIGEGWDNRVFLVNQSFIFRFPRRKIAVELIERENRVLKHLAFYFSLQIPNPLFEGSPSEDYPYPFQGYRCIKGASVGEVGLTPQQRLASLKPLALFLKQLHSVDEKQALAMGAKPQLFDKTEVDKTIAIFQDRVGQLISLGYQIDTKETQQEISATQQIILPDGKCLVHGDLYFKHLIFNQGRLRGIIDWGDLGINCPVVDLAIIWGFYPEKHHALFHEIYGSVDSGIWQYARFLGIYMVITLILYSLDIHDKRLISEASESIKKINNKILKN